MVKLRVNIFAGSIFGYILLFTGDNFRILRDNDCDKLRASSDIVAGGWVKHILEHSPELGQLIFNADN